MQAVLFEVPPLPAPVVATSGAALAPVCLAACLLPSPPGGTHLAARGAGRRIAALSTCRTAR